MSRSSTDIFRNNLVRRRFARELTQTALARKAGIAVPYLNQIESGIRHPTLRTMEKLSKALRISLIAMLKE